MSNHKLPPATLLRLSTQVIRAVFTTATHRQICGPRRPTWPFWLEGMQQILALGISHQDELDINQLRAQLDGLAQLGTRASAQFEWTRIGGAAGTWVTCTSSHPRRVVYYLHGGGYVSGSPHTHHVLIEELARSCSARVLALDYRLAPEHPFPAALVDVWSGYWWLLTTGVLPQEIIVMGDSAGGGLSIALLIALRDAGVPLPAGAVCLSPWLDLTAKSNSVHTNAETDYLSHAAMVASGHMYLNGIDPHTPLASPIFADLRGLPPILLQVGTAEMLLDDAVTFARRATAAGVDVELQLWEDMFHVWHFLFNLLPDARQAINSIGRFVRSHVHSTSQISTGEATMSWDTSPGPELVGEVSAP